MDISINGKPADIVPDTEKTLGELLSGLEQWLSGSGYRLSGLQINGEAVGAAALDKEFNRDLQGIDRLDLSTSFWPELALEALTDTLGVLEARERAAFEDRGRIGEEWEQSAAARFLGGDIPEIYALAARTLRGGSPGPVELAGIIDERLREISDPRGEFRAAGGLVEGIAGRLEELPLDIQTGKDGRAAETVRIFSHITEKVFRLFALLKMESLPADTLQVESLPVNEFIDEFSAALKELLAAYEVKDAVLVGDLAEYELAPRLRKLYGAIHDSALCSV